MRKAKIEEMDSLDETDRLVMRSKVKQWVELASITITILVTGQEDRLDVPGPEGQYSNPPTISFLPFVRSCS